MRFISATKEALICNTTIQQHEQQQKNKREFIQSAQTSNKRTSNLTFS